MKANLATVGLAVWVFLGAAGVERGGGVEKPAVG